MAKYIAIGILLLIIALLMFVCYCLCVVTSRADDTVDKLFDDYWKELDDNEKRWKL